MKLYDNWMQAFENRDFDEVMKFSFNMTFGQDGEHRNHRSGGQHHRKKGEIFCDTFQGKLGEFFVYQNIKNTGLMSNKPDIQTWELGKWDDVDLIINGINWAFLSSFLIYAIA